MIRASLGPDAVFYRCITPKWAYRPTSGAGAAVAGGRFNRPGVEALYLSQDIDTAIAEYRQDSSLPPPATVVTFQVRLAQVADFSKGYQADLWSDDWQDWSANWRRIARIDKETPPSWKLADVLTADGISGLLYPSVRGKRRVNLVVFSASLGPGDRISVYDPDGRLPRDQTSWV